MPVTVYPASHGANLVSGERRPAKTSRDLLKQACSVEEKRCLELLQSSFDSKIEATILPSNNGLVFAAITAYNEHHHLQIAPEDVWFAILSQLSLYINTHSEKLRGKFVAHGGKKELVVVFAGEDRYSVDFATFATEISRLIQVNVVDPGLREWIMPAFTTTSKHDKVVASILMMGAMQKYFNYTCVTVCGLPSVTILGEKSDWQLIDQRLDKLLTFGAEPSKWHSLLKPILSHFIDSFDNPSSKKVLSFWQRIVHFHPNSSGPSHYSGWLTAFCFWDADGNCKYFKPSGEHCLTLNGATYHWIQSKEVPPGYSSVPVKLNDNGNTFDAMMIAGSVGMNCFSSGDKGKEQIIGLDTIRPQRGWWIFEMKSREMLNEESRQRIERREKGLQESGMSEDTIKMLLPVYLAEENYLA